ncbi:BTB/POZ domain-containing protein 2-like isoform X1 [Folsomia candida]|uniref:BTB/POZ domain-containing protein 2-like isoform X1 n=1 Tax=Folsomia candida TaxID=158441 RepID=UPI001604BFFC|nr:BTB/POZ domain-containing protein 2-like isoform X1 [Folsomia candida]
MNTFSSFEDSLFSSYCIDPPPDPRPNWDWTAGHGERFVNLLRTGFRHDLTLHVRPEGVKIPVHRIFLQGASSVLDEKINPAMNELIVDNVNSHILKMLVKYLYTGRSDVVEVADVPKLILAAAQFKIHGLWEECAILLKEERGLEHVLSLFQSGMEHAYGDVIQSTLKLICINARQVLKSEEFLNLRFDCLIEIIQQDSLKVANEVEIFEAVYRWGLAECARRSLDPSNPENLRFCLAKPLNYIRFPLMDPEEYTLVVSTKKLLSLEDSVELLTTFLLPPERRKLLPAGKFISNPRLYISLGGTGIVIGRHFTGGSRQVNSILVASGNPNGSETITPEVDFRSEETFPNSRASLRLQLPFRKSRHRRLWSQRGSQPDH